MTKRRRRRGAASLDFVGGNGLITRRALLGGGVTFVGALGTAGTTTGAGAEPLADAPWSLAVGGITPPVQTASPFEKDVTRTLSKRRADCGLPERRTSDARQRLSDAPAPAWISREHERQVCASNQSDQSTGLQLLRDQELFTNSAGRKDLAVSLRHGGEELHHLSVVWPQSQSAWPLRDFGRGLFRHWQDRQGDGVGRWRQQLGRSCSARADPRQSVYALRHAVALGRPAGNPAEPRLRRRR